MTGRLDLAKVATFAMLVLLVVSTVPFPTMALEVSDEYNITDTSDDVGAPRVAVDSDGDFHLVYLFNDGGNYNKLMYRKVSPTGTTLEGATQLSPGNVESGFDALAISVGPDDRVHVAFSVQTASDDAVNVYYAQLNKAGSVQVTARNVASSGDPVAALDIDADASGNAYIVFNERTDPPTIQWMKVSSSGSVSVQPKEISGELGIGGDLYYPRIGVGSGGTSYIAWQQKSNQLVRISLFYTQLASGGSVTEDPAEVVSNPVVDLTHLEADSDSMGNLHMTFVQGGSIHLATIDDQGGVDRNVEVASSLLGDTGSPDVDVAPNDDVYISYVERENLVNAPYHPFVRVWEEANDSWTDPQVLYDGTGATDSPRVAAGPGLAGVVYFRDGDIRMVTVAKEAGNNPPVADLSAFPLDPKVDQVVSFDGSGSTDPDDGDFVDEYNFEYGDGASSGWISSSSASHSYSSAGTYTARLRVRDSNGLESAGADTVTITVTSGSTNRAPTAVLGVDKTTADVGEDVTFDGSQSFDTDGVVSEYMFSFGDGASTGWQSSATSTHAYAKEGVFTATMKVRDDKGEESELDAVTISVVDTNERPTALIESITPNPAMQGEGITFVGSGTDPDGTIKTYSWESDMDGPIGSTATFTFNGLQVGTHDIIFKVQDDDGAWSDPVTETVVVKANSPFAIKDLTEFPDQVYTDTLVEFRVEYTDPDNDRPLEAKILYSKGSDWKTVELGEVDATDTDYTDGKEYYYRKKFDEGTWKYSFEFRNSKNGKTSSPVDEFKVQKAPGPLPGWETGPAVGAILLAALVVALVMRRREGTP